MWYGSHKTMINYELKDHMLKTANQVKSKNHRRGWEKINTISEVKMNKNNNKTQVY